MVKRTCQHAAGTRRLEDAQQHIAKRQQCRTDRAPSLGVAAEENQNPVDHPDTGDEYEERAAREIQQEVSPIAVSAASRRSEREDDLTIFQKCVLATEPRRDGVPLQREGTEFRRPIEHQFVP